jgi:hypothetical protein
LYNSQGYDFIGDGTGSTNIGLTVGNHIGTSSFRLDPKLGPLANNGGPTLTRLPLDGSPVIDAGDVLFRPPPSSDQRGQSRVSGFAIDIGAVEKTQLAVVLSGPNAGLTAVLTGSGTSYPAAAGWVGWVPATGTAFTLGAPPGAVLTATSIALGSAIENSAGGRTFAGSLPSPTTGLVSGKVTAEFTLAISGMPFVGPRTAIPSDAADSHISITAASDTDIGAYETLQVPVF